MANKDFKAKQNKQLSFFDNIEQKIEQSSSTIAELRVPIFAPVGKIPPNSQTAKEFKKNGNILIRETKWGRVELRGRKILTVTHRDLLDCIYTYNEKIETNKDGSIEIFFSQTHILNRYGIEFANQNLSWLKEKLKEIRDYTINYVDTKGNSFDFNLISNLDYSDEAKMYKIRLDQRYVRFYEIEWSVNYKRELPNLLKVSNDTIKTIIRWFFTHSGECKYRLDDVLDAIGFPKESKNSYDNIKRNLKNAIEELRDFGIEYDIKTKILDYQGNSNIRHYQGIIKFDESVKTIDISNDDDNEVEEKYIGKSILIDGMESKLKSIDYNLDENNIPIDCVIKTSMETLKIPNSGKSLELFKASVEKYLEKHLIK